MDLAAHCSFPRGRVTSALFRKVVAPLSQIKISSPPRPRPRAKVACKEGVQGAQHAACRD